ncbi:cobyrinate a,c-diamide synthase [Desulfatitalea tepidiphila]|uniref:cobyrinate a,c-diamide synthase n=1 Tax=Desulfatitalea tepidiphila TaxID=1185843 RepID=UPI00350E4484
MIPVPSQRPQAGCPGFVVAALRGGSGKTIFSVGIIAALRNRGVLVAPFKKGPDYIDAGWLALAAGRPCYNLDTFLIDSPTIVDSFQRHTQSTGAAVIEGNRGLYDCISTDGLTSTAELAKLLGLPVILCIDATKTTRTMAAVVAGCIQFDPAVQIKGVVLNHVAGARHENILRTSIEEHCGIPVVGAVPKLRKQSFPERHMGLVPTYEHQWAQDAVATIAELAEQYIDLARLSDIAGVPLHGRFDSMGTGTRSARTMTPKTTYAEPALPRPRIGIIRDSAFQFYYPENLDALVQAGADLVVTSPLFEDNLPDVDALYIGGGFPETHAQRLARNVTYRDQIKSQAEQGLPIYAECGGLMYMGRELVLDDGTFPMTGVLPVSFGFSKRPQGHGYTIARVARPNPYFETGQTIKGHEFHYSTVQLLESPPESMAFEMERGKGLKNGLDGLCHNRVLATYTHIHALGTPQWAPALVDRAREFLQAKSGR